MNWKDLSDSLLGTIRVDYACRDALERDLYDFWNSIPAESKSNNHSRVTVIVRDCGSGREFYLNRTLPFDECVSALMMDKGDRMRASFKAMHQTN